jgi:hypothetical protein
MMRTPEMLRTFWSSRNASREYASLDLETREALARDVRVPRRVLDEMVVAGKRPSLPLPRVLRAAGLNVAELEQAYPGVMRDMQVTCTTCSAARLCRRDLSSGVSLAAVPAYCPNTHTIAALGGRTRRNAPVSQIKESME